MSSEAQRCTRCGEPEGCTLHEVQSANAEIRMAAHVFQEPAPQPPYRLIIEINAGNGSYLFRVLEEVMDDLAKHGLMKFQRVSGGGGGSHAVTSFIRDVEEDAYWRETIEWYNRMLERARRANCAGDK